MPQTVLEKKTENIPTYTRKDFTSNQEVRWCPGCGDYSILMSLQKAMPLMNKKKEEFAIISGIGCAARLPYYVDTYGFHSIHGRATSIASGVKLMEPNLSVWVITGDGDGLSIGLGNLLHAIRRNIGIRILLFNNAIYGLTKGQVSPTSPIGKVTKSTPFGHLEQSFLPLPLVLSSGGTFIARTADILTKHSQEMFIECEKHNGTAFVEVLQNCHIFHDGAFDRYTNKEHRNDRMLFLEHGKPMVFGEEREKCIIIDKNTLSLKTALVSQVEQNDILVHDAFSNNSIIHNQLVELDYPLAMGIIKQTNKKTLEESMHTQEKKIKEENNNDIIDFIYSGETWKV